MQFDVKIPMLEIEESVAAAAATDAVRHALTNKNAAMPFEAGKEYAGRAFVTQGGRKIVNGTPVAITGGEHAIDEMPARTKPFRAQLGDLHL